MKQYKTDEELLNYLEAKNVTVKNRKFALKKLEKYTYYSIVNSYKYNLKMLIMIIFLMLLLKKYMLYMNLIKT